MNFWTSQPGWLAHALDGLDLLRVRLDAAFRDEEAEQLSGWDTKDTLFRVVIDLVFTEVGECFLQIVEEREVLLGLHHDIVHVHMDVAAELW